MQAPISYNDARKRYPAHMQEVIAKVHAGSSKLKGREPSAWRWIIVWAMIAPTGVAFRTMIAKAKVLHSLSAEEREVQVQKGYAVTVDERYDDYCRQLRGVRLAAVSQGGIWVSETECSPIPKEVRASVISRFADDYARDQEQSKLSPKARRRDIINHLAGVEDDGKGAMDDVTYAEGDGI